MATLRAVRAGWLPRRLQIWFERWIERRGPTRPPLTLRYRQIFILPTRFGWLLGLLMFAMLMGSLNFNNNLGLLTTFIVAGLASNSMLIAFRNLNGLQVLRSAAEPVFAGQQATLLISLVNPSARTRIGLEIALGSQRQSLSLPPAQPGEACISLPTSHRGWMAPPRMRIQTRQPIGLFQAWSWFRPEQPLLVWPQPATNPPPLPDHAAELEGQDQQHQLEGDEFFSLRNWREGDPLHRVAWKASQRHDTLLARELRRPRSRQLMLDLDQAPGRDREERIRIVTAWTLQAFRQQRSWTLRLGPETLGPDQTEAHLHACLKALATI